MWRISQAALSLLFLFNFAGNINHNTSVCSIFFHLCDWKCRLLRAFILSYLDFLNYVQSTYKAMKRNIISLLKWIDICNSFVMVISLFYTSSLYFHYLMSLIFSYFLLVCFPFLANFKPLKFIVSSTATLKIRQSTYLRFKWLIFMIF